jgi:colicin import membrane protein
MKPKGPGVHHRKRWLAVALSIFVHAGIAAALGWGWWQLHAQPRAPEQLAIEATVILERATTKAPAPAAAPAPEPTPAPAPAPSPPPPEPVHPRKPEPSAARLEAQRAAEQAHREHEEQQQAAAEQHRQQEADQRAAEQRAQQQAQEQEQRAAKDKARRESELRAQLAAEERVNAARGSAEAAAWIALIRDRVTRAWIRPPSARAGVNCEVRVTQVPGGVVTNVQIGECNGDAAVRESIEAAVYRASPLPMPSNPDLFDRSLKFNFHPGE